MVPILVRAPPPFNLIAKTVTWTASCPSYSRRRLVRGRRKNASMPFLACIVRPGLTPNLALMGRRTTTLDLRGISELMVRPGVREGLAMASRRRSARRDMLGKYAVHRGRPRNSTGRRAFIGDVDSPQKFKLLQMTTLRVFRRCNVANARVFFATPPRARRRAGGGLRRHRRHGHSGTTPRRGGAAGSQIP